MYRNNDPMKAYMQDIGVIPLITKEEEIELARKIKAGDLIAKQKLIKSNLRLVVKIAHDFKGLGLPLLDLISEGNIGLMRAAEKFDPAKGAKFSSYSAWWIKQAMRRALSQKSRTIRVPVASAGKINKIRSAKIQLTEKLGRNPTDSEIADHLDLTKRTIQGLKLADLRTFSMHDPIQKGEDGNFEDIIPDASASKPDDIIEDAESIQRLKGLIHNLDDRERTILIMRYGLDGSRPKTLEEVSVIIGRTRERVRQIQMHSLKKLRALIEDERIDNEGKIRRPPVSIDDAESRNRTTSHFTRRSAHRKSASIDDSGQFNAQGGGSHRRNSRSAPILEGCIGAKLAQCTERILHECDEAPLSELQISRRSVNGLHSVDIHTVGQLISRSSQELLSIRYFGNKCLSEVQDAVTRYVIPRIDGNRNREYSRT